MDDDGVEPGIASVKSSTKGMAFGNILFGGIIGAGVDMASGAAYDYPDVLAVQMGATQTIDAPTQEHSENAANDEAKDTNPEQAIKPVEKAPEVERITLTVPPAAGNADKAK